MTESTDLEAQAGAKYAEEQHAIARLAALDRKALGPGAADNLKLLKEVGTKGLTATLESRKRFPARQSEIRAIVGDFVEYGAKAALLTGSQRGGDFLNNQLRGAWAERVVLSMPVSGLQFVAFGPSGAAMPGEEDHRLVIMTFKEIQLLEGKRPDLLAFDRQVWESMTEPERGQVATWPTRRLEPSDEEIVKKARCGIEVKNSLWHYETRRQAGGGPLSITMKDEEVPQIQNWTTKTGLPVLFVQVLFDEMYCMSFRRMQEAIRRGFLYEDGDCKLNDPDGEKMYHRFSIEPGRHLCGKVAFPSESVAQVRILNDGSVVPYIDLLPAQAREIVESAILAEIGYTG